MSTYAPEMLDVLVELMWDIAGESTEQSCGLKRQTSEGEPSLAVNHRDGHAASLKLVAGFA